MTSKGISKSSNLFETINDSDRDIYKATVKITTFSSKEEKWVQHSYEETHINRGRQFTSLKASSTKTASDSVEGLDQIENTIKKALRDSSSDNSQSEEDRQRLKEMNDFLMQSTKQIKKMYQEKSTTSSLGYLDPNKFFPDEKKKLVTVNAVSKIEENLKNDIDNILFQIYNEHINKTQEFDFTLFENQVNIFAESATRKSNIHILQILTEKICIVIEKIKDKIYIIKEVRVLKEKFYELKLNHENKTDCLDKSKLSCKTKGVELNEKIKKAIKEMLIELRENIYSVLESSFNIQKVFAPIVQHLNEETNSKFNFEEIHREEFSKSVAKDEFLKIIFLQIKSNAKNPNYKELHEILMDIEEVLKYEKEMTRFRNLLDLVYEKINLNINLKSNNFTKECQSILNGKKTEFKCNCNHKEGSNLNTPKPENINKIPTKTQNLLKKDKFKDIDELINYINKDEPQEAKPKKNKKKNNKKEKKPNNNDQGSSFDTEKMEKEIEEFKFNLAKCSINALKVKKIKPALTREWLNSLAKEVKSI